MEKGRTQGRFFGRAAVIGSGAAGVSCASALVARGIDVTVFDGGEKLEPELEAVRQRMASLRPSQWEKEDLNTMRGGISPNAKGIPKKFAFGSDYPFRDPAGVLNVRREGTELLSSLAEGGLSTIWGASIFPWRSSEFNGWPIRLSDLEVHYKSVLRFVPITGTVDDLAEEYPLYHDQPGNLRLSNQARELLADLQRHRSSLRRAGMIFGKARLAIRTATGDDPTSGCEYCGQCLYGCPYLHIYSSAWTLQSLLSQKAIHYENGVYIERFEDMGNSVRLYGRRREDGANCEFEFDRAFIAAGAIPSARIVLHSLGAYDTPITLKENQYFFIPLMRFKGISGVRKEALYSLSQIFLEINDDSITPRGIHLQFYSYSDIYERVLTNMLPLLAKIMPMAIEATLSRLFILQGYLHSDDSGTTTVTLAKGNGTRGGELKLTARPNPQSVKIVKAAMRKITRHAADFRGAPAWPMVDVGPVGISNHSGGSFPMAAFPGVLQTDRLGRLGGSGRVHLVDASVLPDIAATTLTYTAMANAHRIGWETAELFAST